MKSWCKNLLAAGLGMAVLTACSSNDVEEEPVSELTEINATVFPEINWSDSVGDGVGDYYSRLRPAVDYGKIFVADRELSPSGVVLKRIDGDGAGQIVVFEKANRVCA